MRKPVVFYFKLILVIVGFLLIGFGFFADIESNCFSPFSPQQNPTIIFTPGSKSVLWFLFLIASTLIFLSGFFFRHLAGKILVYLFSVIFIPFIAFMTEIYLAEWGDSCGNSLESGYYITLFGSLMVLTATIISMHRKKRITGRSESELLDQ